MALAYKPDKDYVVNELLPRMDRAGYLDFATPARVLARVQKRGGLCQSRQTVSLWINEYKSKVGSKVGAA